MTPKLSAAASRAAAAFLTVVVIGTVAGDAAAEPALVQPDIAKPALRYDVPLDLSVTIGGILVASTFEILSTKIAPSSCRWCDRNADGSDSLNGFDAGVRRALRWSNTGAADATSTVFSFVLAPAAGVGVGALIAWRDDRLDEFPVDLLVVAEAAVVAVDLNEVSKVTFARERPNVHARTPADRAAEKGTGDNLSFFSGHTTLAFALATSAGTVASMRRHRLAPVMWVTGLALAATGGYLRIAADQHYATDVITGVVVGSAVGIGLPYFAHRPLGPTARLAPLTLDHGGGLSIYGTW